MGQACDWTAESTREDENRSKTRRAKEREEALPTLTPTPMRVHPGLQEGAATSLDRISVCEG